MKLLPPPRPKNPQEFDFQTDEANSGTRQIQPVSRGGELRLRLPRPLATDSRDSAEI